MSTTLYNNERFILQILTTCASSKATTPKAVIKLKRHKMETIYTVVGTITPVIISAVGFIMWLSKLGARVTLVEKRQDKKSEEIDALDDKVVDVDKRVAVIEAQFKDLRETINNGFDRISKQMSEAKK